MKNFYEGGRGLCPPQNVETSIYGVSNIKETQCIASLRRRKRRLKHTSTVQRGECYLFDRVSAVVRSLIGFCSRQRLVLFDRCSTALRQVFDSSSTPSRSAVEADPKDCRRSPEAVPNTSRSGLEEFPKRSRRNLGFWDLFMYRRGTLSVPLMYERSTVDVLPKYYGGTKELPTTCTSGVDQDRDDGRGIYHEQALRNVSIKRDASCLRRKRSKHISTVQRGEVGIPRSIQMYLRIFLFNMRRGEKCFAQLIRANNHLPLRIFFIFFVSLLFSLEARPQPRGKLGTAPGQQQEFFVNLKGQVLDTETSKPIAGVSVILDKVFRNTIVVRTDADGAFEIKGVFIPACTLAFAHQGYERTEVTADRDHDGPFTIRMRPTAREIEEVVVEVNTGYFSVPKERATGSYAHIDGTLLNRSIGSNILDRLDGVTKGAIFNTADMGKTRLRNQASIGIRGISTINGNAEPLIILDNFPYEGDIDDLNPDDIESVTVLQDAAAASIWGARAGNGVIVLTSKTGKLRQPMRIQWRNDASVSAKPDLYYTPTIPMAEWVGIEKFQFDNNLWNGIINQRYTYITPVVDVLLSHRDGDLSDTERDEALARLAGQDVRKDLSRYVYRHSSLLRSALSLQGGQERMRYYLSTGIDRNNGQLHRQGSTRYTINSRNTFELWKDRLSLDASVSLTDTRSSSGGNVYYPTLYSRLADDDGNHLSVGGGRLYRQRYIDTVGGGLLLDWNMRPLDEVDLTTVSTAATAYQLQSGLDFHIANGLKFTGAYRYMSRAEHAEIYADPEAFDVRNNINLFSRIDYTTGAVTSAVPDGGTFREVSYRKASHHARGQLSFDRQWGVHHVSALAGAEINQLKGQDAYSALWLGYDPDTESYTPVDYTALHRIITTGGNSRISGSPANPYRLHTIDRTRLYFGNAAYHYDQRYGVTFSIRKDEANIFGAEANMRGKPFWSVGGLWHVHHEKFFDLSFVDKLSLRATTGAMGNVSTASAYTTSTVASTPYVYSGNVYQSISTPPNPSLSWEKIRMSNFGIDFAFFGNRLSGSIEHYRKKSTDLLSSAPIHPSSGVSTLYGNWSSLSAKGWDLVLHSKNLRGKLDWHTDILLSTVKDEVTDYKLKPSNERDYMTSNLGLGYYPIEGKPLYSLFSLRSAGLDANGDPQGYLDGEVSKEYNLLYNSTKLSDFVYHGRATPSVFGSVRNTFAYRNVELSFNIAYRFGYYFRRSGLSSSAVYAASNYSTGIFQADYDNRWQKEGDEGHTRVPRLQFPLNANRESFYQYTEDLIEKGDHIRLRDLRLAYHLLPKTQMGGIKKVEVYFFASNLGILWRANKHHIDPDMIPNQSLIFPTPGNYAAGLTLNF